ncbi:helix-turn-helix domain-containing protein [Sorangium sp. So ce260]|uniref:helix-turn-helix domain-containing protein n=1 Tax=Sorangium sp. So ce260 TaxID=3133291 RepID=UPI003F62681A
MPKEPIAMAGEILIVAEAAPHLKVAAKAVYTMAQNAELPWFKVRGQWRFRRQDLDTWMAAQVAGAGAPGPPATKAKAPTRKGRGRR